MPRWAFAALALLVFLLVGTQVLIPNLAERRVQDRLTENGGRALVELGAVPALRLLFGDGERFEVEGSGLQLELDERTEVFERLDGFSEVDISIGDFNAGPLAMESFDLSREGDGAYRLVAAGEASAAELAQLGFEAVELPGESFLDALLGEVVPATSAPLPIELDMELESDAGQVRVVSGGGSVAGIPTGPLARLITSAIVVRL